MQLKKLILFFFILNNIYSQPGSKKAYLKLNFIIDEILFTTKDSSDFYSSNRKIKLNIYRVTNDNFSKKEKLKLCNKFEEKFYTLNATNKYFNIRMITSISYNDEILSTKKIFIEIKKNKAVMKLLFNFSEKQDDIKVEDLKIFFNEGIYKINDPDNPKLVVMKEKF